ncbi:MAG: aspartate aminotransferase family protein [Bacteroidetes bacterium]|nr:aspartate aminotransferase family protein [Bacteroidota bacterium]
MLDQFASLLTDVVEGQHRFRARWQPFQEDTSLAVDDASLRNALQDLQTRLQDNYPFFHPMYAGQMLKPPHQAAVLGYLAAMLINPNNHALDGGPATGQIEKELTADLAQMFGYTAHLGHLTSSGTIANLEALYIARHEQPGRAVAFSAQAHYTHSRMCEVLGMRAFEVPADRDGRINADALNTLCLSEDIGTVVATLGTTGLGALDPLPQLLELRERHGFRIHVDAAYGGFFTLIADDAPDGVSAEVFGAMHEADSIVVDPHKHGLQPYGCGCVLFRDPAVGRHYVHDSPYTYFTSDDLHLGEISLECSRAGASAAALWMTLRMLPLDAETGLGAVLRRCRSAATQWSEKIRTSEKLSLVLEPELDIVAFFPDTRERSATAISKHAAEVFERTMNDAENPLYLSKLRVPTALLAARYPDIRADAEWTTVLRSALMKPEHAGWIERIHSTVEQIV